MLNRSLLIIFLAFLIGIAIQALLPLNDNSLLLFSSRIIVGIVVFLLIPGLSLIVLLGDGRISNFAFALIFGFLFQLLNVLIAWGIYTLIGHLNFMLLIRFDTLLFTTVTILFTLKKSPHLKWRSYFKTDSYLLFAFFLFIIIALSAQSFFPSPHSDGAAYLDLARNVVSNNVFSSNTLYPVGSWNAAQFSTGMINYFFGYSGIAIFFALGTVSLFSAKLMLIFAGSLALFPLFLISEKLFDKDVARIAVFLMSFSPLLLTYVGLVGGPEIISLLFLLTTIYLIFNIIDDVIFRFRLCLVAGFTAFVTWFAWLFNGYILLLSIPFIFLLYKSEKFRGRKFEVFLILLLLVASFYMDVIFLGQVSYRYLLFPIPLAFLSLGSVVFMFRRKLHIQSFYLLFLAVALCLIFLVSYAPRLISGPFIAYDTANFPTAQQQVLANAAQNVNLLYRAVNVNAINSVLNSYFTGSGTWSGILESFGVVVLLLAVLSIIRFDKFKQTLLVFCFPILDLLLWVFLGPDMVVQARYFLTVAPFYFMLASSTFGLVITQIKWVPEKNLCVLKFRNSKVNIKPVLLLIIILFSVTLISWQPIYQYGLQNGQSWNYEQRFGWNPAISWIKNNTSPIDKLAAVEGSFFAWYTDRQTAYLWYTVPKNSAGLIDTIRDQKINYLIVDLPFTQQFTDLRTLYNSPSPFLGSPIAFSSDAHGEKVIIYNVTNIAYGVLTQNEYQLNWTASKNWAPLSYYSTGNVSTSEEAAKFSLNVGQSSWPSAAVSFTMGSPKDLSKYTHLQFWVLVPNCSQIVTQIVSSDSAGSYYSYVSHVSLFNQWQLITLDLTKYTSFDGHPSLANVNQLDIILNGQTVGKTTTFYVKDLHLYSESYYLPH